MLEVPDHLLSSCDIPVGNIFLCRHHAMRCEIQRGVSDAIVLNVKRAGKWPCCDDSFWGEVWRIDNLSVQMEAFFLGDYFE